MVQKKDRFFGWIEATLVYGGSFGSYEKKVYGQVFGLSESTVSRHQGEFVDLYESCHGPMFVRNEAGHIEGGKLRFMDDADIPPEPGFPGAPDLMTWLKESFPKRNFVKADIERKDPESWVIRLVSRAIEEKTPISVSYHSRSGPKERTLSPHAIVHVAGRYHMRAFDHSRNEFRDYLLSRITRGRLTTEGFGYVDGQGDRDWNKTTRVIVAERSGDQDENIRTGIQMDFGLEENGKREVKLRKALVQYLVDEMMESYASPVSIRAPED